MNIKTISLISQITTLFLFTNLRFNHLLLVTIKEVLILVEMVDVADIVEEVHMVGVEEEETSKLTAKVGKFKHLLSLLPKHFLTQMRHNQLNSFQITFQTFLMSGEMNSFQINKFKFSCIIRYSRPLKYVKRKPQLTLQVAILRHQPTQMS